MPTPFTPPPKPMPKKTSPLSFRRRARGIPIWAVLKTLGRQGVSDMVERHCAQAQKLATGIDGKNGIKVINDVVLNQVLCTTTGAETPQEFTSAHERHGQACGLAPTVWRGKPAFRLSVSNWRTT